MALSYRKKCNWLVRRRRTNWPIRWTQAARDAAGRAKRWALPCIYSINYSYYFIRNTFFTFLKLSHVWLWLCHYPPRQGKARPLSTHPKTDDRRKSRILPSAERNKLVAPGSRRTDIKTQCMIVATLSFGMRPQFPNSIAWSVQPFNRTGLTFVANKQIDRRTHTDLATRVGLTGVDKGGRGPRPPNAPAKFFLLKQRHFQQLSLTPGLYPAKSGRACYDNPTGRGYFYQMPNMYTCIAYLTEIRKFCSKNLVHKGVNFEAQNALKLTYEHL